MTHSKPNINQMVISPNRIRDIVNKTFDYCEESVNSGKTNLITNDTMSLGRGLIFASINYTKDSLVNVLSVNITFMATLLGFKFIKRANSDSDKFSIIIFNGMRISDGQTLRVQSDFMESIDEDFTNESISESIKCMNTISMLYEAIMMLSVMNKGIVKNSALQENKKEQGE